MSMTLRCALCLIAAAELLYAYADGRLSYKENCVIGKAAVVVTAIGQQQQQQTLHQQHNVAYSTARPVDLHGTSSSMISYDNNFCWTLASVAYPAAAVAVLYSKRDVSATRYRTTTTPALLIRCYVGLTALNHYGSAQLSSDRYAYNACSSSKCRVCATW
eukprot:20562-Heterococcus_DN1.PRE.4